jgi:hypothetical protein
VLLIGAVVARGNPSVRAGYLLVTGVLAVLALILAGVGSFTPTV